MIFKKYSHPKRVNICCEFQDGSIMGTLVFETEAGEAFPVNDALDRDMKLLFFTAKVGRYGCRPHLDPTR